MAKSLVIVESKAKAKTINEYLGKNFKVVASMGHVRDLPKSPKKLTRAGMQLDEGIDVQNGFVPDYENISTRKDVIKEVIDSGLRGRGGAAFPTGIKWSFMVRSPGPPKFILCNCEEGDPGAYNDKGILESDPYTLLEGMTIAGYATGATKGFVFIRHGHDGPIDRTENAIRKAYSLGLLGKNILGSDFDFDIEVALTGESYVSGEETALMRDSGLLDDACNILPAPINVWEINVKESS